MCNNQLPVVSQEFLDFLEEALGINEDQPGGPNSPGGSGGGGTSGSANGSSSSSSSQSRGPTDMTSESSAPFKTPSQLVDDELAEMKKRLGMGD